jgi:hypothetical protein
MTWFGWLLVGLIALGGLLSVGQIGRPREPLTPGTGALIVVLDALLILGVVLVGTKG